VLEVLTNRLGIGQVMVRFHQTAEEFLLWRPAHLPHLHRPQLRHPGLDRLPAFFGQRSWPAALRQRIGHDPPHRRQFNPARAVQGQHHAPADHAAQPSIGLNPVPGAAQLGG